MQGPGKYLRRSGDLNGRVGGLGAAAFQPRGLGALTYEESPTRAALKPFDPLTMPRRTDETTVGDPSLRQQYHGLLLDALMAIGASKYTAQHYADGIMGLSDFTPVGILTSADEARRAYNRGAYGETAVAALGAIPAAGKPIKAGAKVGKKAAGELLEAFTTNGSRTYPGRAPNHIAFGTHEAAPGADGHLPGLNATEQQAHDAHPGSWWQDAAGRDVLYDAQGLVGGETRPTVGVFEGTTNRGQAAPALGSGEGGIADRAANAAREALPGAATGVLVQKVGGAIANRIAASRLKDRAARFVTMYDPPAKSPRPFAEDYPFGARSDETGKLITDIEGSPLVAPRVVGRRVVGGIDEALPPEELNSLTEAAIGRRPETATKRQIGEDLGRTTYDPITGEPRRVFLARDLTPPQALRVLAHEVGHVVDQLAGLIPTNGLNRELRHVYNTLVTGRERSRHLTGPEHYRYRGEEVHRELIVEAVRAYMTNPNYLKTLAPETAKRIREVVNSNPRLRNIIQFNSLVGAAGAGLIGEEMAGQMREPSATGPDDGAH